jgi:hypothetical protein
VALLTLAFLLKTFYLLWIAFFGENVHILYIAEMAQYCMLLLFFYTF